MEELQKQIINILKEEHQDWVRTITDAEQQGRGVDVNLGGNFADRLQKLIQAFNEYKVRKDHKKGLFGGK